MRILAIEKAMPGITGDDVTPELVEAQARRAWELHEAGTVRELYHRADEASAVLVLECDSLDEATAAIASLPLVAAGLVEFEILPLRSYPQATASETE
jgi:muconolactone delta-isomerase